MILLLLSTVLSMACLGNEGAYVIKVKIYLDEDSRMAISDYMQNQMHPNDILDPNKEGYNYSLAYIREYFGLIFDEVNTVLDKTDIQLEADFSEMMSHEFDGMKEKYCVLNTNITEITEAFASEFNSPRDGGNNRILIINCRRNNGIMSFPDHYTNRNACAKIHGIILIEPSTMKNMIIDGLYNIFSGQSVTKLFGISKTIAADACAYAHLCNRFFNTVGEFVTDLKAVRHVENTTLNEKLDRANNFRSSKANQLPDNFPLVPSV